MKKKLFNWEPSFAVLIVVCAVIGLSSLIIKANQDFKVVHFQAVESTVGADGRAAVGSPEVYQVQISPALAYKKMSGVAKLFQSLSFVFLILLAVYVVLAAKEVFQGSNVHVFVLMGIILACYFGAYSSCFVSNYVELGKEQYLAIKDSSAALKALFEKPLIR